MLRLPLSCSQASGRGRLALLCGVAAFVLAQLGLGVALNAWPPLRDPEYGRRLESLHARLAERAPGRPLVLFLGSSRIATGVQPALLPCSQRPGGAGPVIFNYAICGSGPVWELLTLRRLVDDGVRPDCVFVEVWPYQAGLGAQPSLLETRFPSERLRWGDLEALRAYSPAADAGSRRWYEDQVVPCLFLRTWLLNQWAPAWVSPDQRVGATFDGLDGWGWLAVPPQRDGRHDPRRAQWAENYVAECDQFRPSRSSGGAFAELFALCRREKITAVLLTTPDPYAPRVEAGARRRTDAWLCGLSAENDVPLIDARGWASEEDFFDHIHLTRASITAFTGRLDREVLRPYFAGEPLARRWPPGRLNAVPAAADGANP